VDRCDARGDVSGSHATNSDAGAADLTAASASDLSGAGACTAATSGFYAIHSSGLGLVLISPDPNEWDGTFVKVVDQNNAAVEAVTSAS